MLETAQTTTFCMTADLPLYLAYLPLSYRVNLGDLEIRMDFDFSLDKSGSCGFVPAAATVAVGWPTRWPHALSKPAAALSCEYEITANSVCGAAVYKCYIVVVVCSLLLPSAGGVRRTSLSRSRFPYNWVHFRDLFRARTLVCLLARLQLAVAITIELPRCWCYHYSGQDKQVRVAFLLS